MTALPQASCRPRGVRGGGGLAAKGMQMLLPPLMQGDVEGYDFTCRGARVRLSRRARRTGP